MENTHLQIADFFDQYASRFNRSLNGEMPDIDGTAHSFALCFIEANPYGVTCGKNDEDFRSMIPKGYDFYKSIGITSMTILSKETTILDNHHAMTKIHWKSNFARKDNSIGSIEFDVIYFLQIIENEFKIFAYITGDEQKALKENGLI